MVNRATCRFTTELGVLDLKEQACFATANRILAFVFNRDKRISKEEANRIKHAHNGGGSFAMRLQAGAAFMFLPVGVTRDNFFEAVSRRRRKFKIKVMYIKCVANSKYCKIMYDVLKGFPEFSKYLTRREGNVDTINRENKGRERREIGIRLDGDIPVYTYVALIHTLRLLDEQWSPAVRELLLAIKELPNEQAVLALLLAQKGDDALRPKRKVLWLAGEVIQGGHCLQFLMCKSGITRYSKAAIDGVLSGSLDYFFSNTAKGRELTFQSDKSTFREWEVVGASGMGANKFASAKKGDKSVYVFNENEIRLTKKGFEAFFKQITTNTDGENNDAK